MTRSQPTRRHFLATSVAAAGSLIGSAACSDALQSSTVTTAPDFSLGAPSEPTSPSPVTATAQRLSAPLPSRSLGRTQMTVPILGLGGSASPLSRTGAEAEAIAIIERAYESGIRYFDTAANYGPSEERLGKVLPAVRSEVMIATKTNHRDRDRAWRQLEQSLQRLQTDFIDLWQFHAITHDWDVDTLLDPRQGAIKAAEEAREQGIIGAIGVTGHNNPDIFVKALTQYPFDTALIPINAADRHTPKPFIDTVLPVAQQHNTGIIAMKVPAYGRLFQPGVLNGMAEAIGYTLSQPQVHCCIIAVDTLEQLAENIAAARAFQTLSADALSNIEQRTATVWQNASFFRGWS